MSIKIMSEVFSNSRSEGTNRLVMLALADHCGDDGLCFPGILKIAEKCRVSERSVQRAISELEALGELSVKRGQGMKTESGWTNLFKLSVPRGDNLSPLPGTTHQAVTDKAPSGDIQGAQAVTALSPKPSGEPSDKPSGGYVPTPEDLTLSSEVTSSRKPRPGTIGVFKPTLQQLQDFCISIGLPASDGEYCFHKWEGNGWRNGNQVIKNWQATIRSWNLMGYLPSNKAPKQPTATAQAASPPEYEAFIRSHPSAKVRDGFSKWSDSALPQYDFIRTDFRKWLKTRKH